MVASDARSTLVAETLARLHDITVPTAPPLWPPPWPPTPGVSLVLLLAVLLLTLALRALSRRWQDGSWRRAARRELAMLRVRIAACDDDGERSRLLAELATLLRRAALHTAAREDVAALSGTDWLAFLVEPCARSRRPCARRPCRPRRPCRRPLRSARPHRSQRRTGRLRLCRGLDLKAAGQHMNFVIDGALGASWSLAFPDGALGTALSMAARTLAAAAPADALRASPSQPLRGDPRAAVHRHCRRHRQHAITRCRGATARLARAHLRAGRVDAAAARTGAAAVGRSAGRAY
jgi:hypothetical protein